MTSYPTSKTVTVHGNQSVSKGYAESTVYETIIKTITIGVPTQDALTAVPTGLGNGLVTKFTTSYVTSCPVTRTVTTGGSQIVSTGYTRSTAYEVITRTLYVVAPTAVTQAVVTTEFITSYVTNCPVTQTITENGSKRVSTGVSASTVYEVITSTICTKCLAPPTPTVAIPSEPAGTTEVVRSTVTTCPVTKTVTSAGTTSLRVTQTTSTVYERVTLKICHECAASPTVTPAVESNQKVITTVIVYTTLTTCPVTKTYTIGKSTSLEYTQTASTIYETVTSTICTKCHRPTTAVPGSISSHVSVATSTPRVSIVTSALSTQQPHGNPPASPVTPKSVASSTPSVKTVPETHVSVPTVSYATVVSSSPGAPGTPVVSYTTVVSSPVPNGPSVSRTTVVSSVPGNSHTTVVSSVPGNSHTTVVSSVPGNSYSTIVSSVSSKPDSPSSPAAPVKSASSSVATFTVVPVPSPPTAPSKTVLPPAPQNTHVQPGHSQPVVSGNGTTPGSPTASSPRLSSSLEAFKGSATKLGTSFMGSLLMAAAILFVL